MARQLGQIGRAVESVMLIDTFSINARPTVRALASVV
jgi:thioesterase domain-containing protein